MRAAWSEDPRCGNPDPCRNDDGLECTGDTCDSETGACSYICNGSVATFEQTCQGTVKLKEIRFAGFGRVLVHAEIGPCEANNVTNCWGTTGGIVAGSQWKHTANPDRAAAYVRGTTMDLVVKIAAHGGSAGTGTLRVTGPDGLVGEGSFSVTGCTPVNQAVTITTSALPNVVKAYTRMGLSWSIKNPGGTTFHPLRNTAHHVFVTLGQPTGNLLETKSMPTKRRLNFVCHAAAQAGDALTATEGIHARLDEDPPDDGNAGVIVDDWRLMAGPPYTGECHNQAYLMKLAIQLIGVPGGTVQKIKASTDTNPLDWETTTAAQLGITEDLDGDGVAGETNEVLTLIFDFNPPPPNPPPGWERSWNNFEGALQTTGGFYAVWPSHQTPSACELLLRLLLPENEENPELGGEGAKQYWVFTRPDGSLYHYPNEVSGPTSCP